MSLDYPPYIGRESPAQLIDSMMLTVPPVAKFPAKYSPPGLPDYRGIQPMGKTPVHGPLDCSVPAFAPELDLRGLADAKAMQDPWAGEQAQKRITGRKRQKGDAEDKKERQAAKNRETAKAFRNKMDTLRNYSAARVSSLKIWVEGLGELAFSRKASEPCRRPSKVKRSFSSPM